MLGVFLKSLAIESTLIMPILMFLLLSCLSTEGFPSGSVKVSNLDLLDYDDKDVNYG
jgi:hypothetical protein